MQGQQDINPDTLGGISFSFPKYANEDTKGPIRAPSWTMSFWHSLQPKNKSWRPDPTENNDSIAYVLSAYFPPINLSTNIPILYDAFLTSLYEKHIFMRQNTITSGYEPDILFANFTCVIGTAISTPIQNLNEPAPPLLLASNQNIRMPLHTTLSPACYPFCISLVKIIWWPRH